MAKTPYRQFVERHGGKPAFRPPRDAIISGTPSIDEIMAYEDGTMEPDQIQGFFERLVKSGLIRYLRGSYGREAARRGLL